MRLAVGNRRIEGRHLDHSQCHQRQQPHQPDTDQEVTLRTPEQTGAHQAIDQHEQCGQQGTLVQQTRAFDRHFHGVSFTNNPGFHGRARQVEAEGHRQCSCSYNDEHEPETSTEHTQRNARTKPLPIKKQTKIVDCQTWQNAFKRGWPTLAADD
ncbi:hypothetical protein D3C84_880660 [compost metagenome]